MSSHKEVNKNTNVFCIVGFGFSFLSSILGVILSVLDLIQVKQTGEKGKYFSLCYS